MEGIFMGQITGSVSSVEDGETRAAQIYFSGMESNACSKLSYYNKTYSLVLSDDVIKTNDELLKLREKVKKLEAELMEVKTARTLREAYITGVEKGCESLREERDRWKRRWNSVVTDISKSLAANGVEFKLKENDGEATWVFIIDIPELNEAKDKIIDLEQKVRDERRWCDYWRHTYYAAEKVASVVGVSVKIDGIDGQHNSAKVIVRNDKAEELKKKVEDLEKKLAAAKSNETYWRDRKEEEEDYHHYWHYTFDRAVKQAAEKGVYIAIAGKDDDCNAGIVTLDNMKAEGLEKQVTTLTDSNKKLNQQVLQLEKDYQNLKEKLGAADNALEYWNNTYNDIVIAGKNVGVKIDIKGKKSDTNAGFVYVTNEMADALKNRTYWRNTYYAAVEAANNEGVAIVYQGMSPDHNAGVVKVMNHRVASFERQIKRLEDDNSAKADALVNAKDRGDYWLREHDVKSRMYQELEQKHDAKWTAMCDALKAKDVEVIYMGEEDGKPIVDVKVPKLDELQKESDARAHQIDILGKDYFIRGQIIRDLKKEIEDLKSKKVATFTLEAGADGVLTFIYTYVDGHNEAAHINCLCKNYVAFDAENISCGTVPKCSSCAHYMHNPSRWAHDWCHKPVSKEGPGTIRRLSTEEAEGPACSDFKARKE